jgi:hypothetical protein
MKKQPTIPGSTIACVNKRDGTVLKAGTVSRMIGPAVVDPFHVMLGAGIDDWGVCIYLTLADAANLNAALDQLITEHTQRG